MEPGTIEYASSYFKCKIPTPIRGEPTHKSLKRLQTELQANDSSVETYLGGENHGYLGLVKTDAELAEIPNASPFATPAHPPALAMSEYFTPIKALELKEEHAEQKRLYLECKNVEKASQRHIQDAVEEKYVDPLIDEHANLLTDDIPTVMTCLV